MRYLAVLGLLIVVGLIVSLIGTRMVHTTSTSYDAATHAAQKAAGAAEQHVQNVLKTVGVTKP